MARTRSWPATNNVEKRLALVDRDRMERALERTRQSCRILDPLAIAPAAAQTCSKAGSSSRSISGGLLLRIASPLGYIALVARRTALHIELFMITNSTGRSCAAAAWWTATGLPNRCEPSPNVAMTSRSGAASFAPSTAPPPQPSPEAGLDPK